MSVHVFAALLAITFIAGGALVAYIAANKVDNKYRKNK